jgi:hypothetical protein
MSVLATIYFAFHCAINSPALDPEIEPVFQPIISDNRELEIGAFAFSDIEQVWGRLNMGRREFLGAASIRLSFKKEAARFFPLLGDAEKGTTADLLFLLTSSEGGIELTAAKIERVRVKLVQ